MPDLVALETIGSAWPAGETRHVEASRAALLVNAGWAKPAETDLDPENPADDGTNPKE